jgi:CheY-like chemotaxis protein
MVALQQMYEETQAKLDQEREERSALLAELDELRRSTTAARLKAAAPPPAQPAAKPEIKAPPLRFAESTPTAAAQPKSTLSLDGVTIVHLEENKDYREAVQRVAKAIPNSRYGNTWEPKQLEKTQSLVLVVNLLNRAHDPIMALARASAEDPTRRVFAYCADGKFGFLFGPATFFTPPLEPSACSAWLVASCGSPHKLLVASSDIEMTSRLRTEFNRIRCSTSVALDLRQVLDLLPLIQPDVVLVDLSLPRGEGLRLISRLRSEEKTARLPLAVLLPSPQNIAEFRQSAQLAARDGTLSPASLTAALSTELGVSLPAGEGDTVSRGLATPKAS